MRVKLFEIVSDVDKVDIEKVKNVLGGKDCIRDYAYVIHDQDETRPHYHIAVRLNNSYDTKYIAEWFGVAENFVNKVKGRWSDMLKYLIHENAPDKFQYGEDVVVSNFDWATEKNKNSKDTRLDEILELIDNGTIREYNYYEYLSSKEYVKYKRSIEIAHGYRTDKLKGVEREMEAIFITGDSGTGKTTMAKSIAEDKGYSVYISSGSNDILDDYKGQDCIILDDLRPSSLGLSDLLKMLDNHTASTVKSRYKNKVLECKLIIITTVLNIDTFFNNVFSEEKETSIQLKRRCKTHVRLARDYAYMKMWMEKSKCYGKEFKMLNPVNLKYKVRDLTEEEQLAQLSEVLGVGKEMIDDIRDNFDEYEQIDLDKLLSDD